MRQLTQIKDVVPEKIVSKLPMRQLTNHKIGVSENLVSKLPMRQLTPFQPESAYHFLF